MEEMVECQLSYALGKPVIEYIRLKLITLLLGSKEQRAELNTILKDLELSGVNDSSFRINRTHMEELVGIDHQLQVLQLRRAYCVQSIFEFNEHFNLAQAEYPLFKILKNKRRIKGDEISETETKYISAYNLLWKKIEKEDLGKKNNLKIQEFLEKVKRHNPIILKHLGLVTINKDTIRKYVERVDARANRAGIKPASFIHELRTKK